MKDLGRGLHAEAHSVPDGIIEAIRWSGGSYVVGLQWHPEFHARSGNELLDCSPVLAEFLDHARAKRESTPRETVSSP